MNNSITLERKQIRFLLKDFYELRKALALWRKGKVVDKKEEQKKQKKQIHALAKELRRKFTGLFFGEFRTEYKLYRNFTKLQKELRTLLAAVEDKAQQQKIVLLLKKAAVYNAKLAELGSRGGVIEKILLCLSNEEDTLADEKELDRKLDEAIQASNAFEVVMQALIKETQAVEKVKKERSGVSQNTDEKMAYYIQYDFCRRLHDIFTGHDLFHFPKKKVFCGGTAPMRQSNTEVSFILYSTDFDECTLVDPGYVELQRLNWDIQEIQRISDKPIPLSNKSLKPDEKLTITFKYGHKKRKITFIAGDVTEEENIPSNFNIYFSGRRTGIGPDKIDIIIRKLQPGGFLVPDYDFEDDTGFFSDHPRNLSLKELRRTIRPAPQKISRQNSSVYFTRFNQYFREAINSGRIKPKPVLRILKFKDGEELEDLPDQKEKIRTKIEQEINFKLKKVIYPSIGRFFSLHPQLKIDDYSVAEMGLFSKTSDFEISFAESTPEEKKIIKDIANRSKSESIKEITLKGIGLYQKVSV